MDLHEVKAPRYQGFEGHGGLQAGERQHVRSIVQPEDPMQDTLDRILELCGIAQARCPIDDLAVDEQLPTVDVCCTDEHVRWSEPERLEEVPLDLVDCDAQGLRIGGCGIDHDRVHMKWMPTQIRWTKSARSNSGRGRFM